MRARRGDGLDCSARRLAVSVFGSFVLGDDHVIKLFIPSGPSTASPAVPAARLIAAIGV